MYSPDIERVCALCVNAKSEKGISTHVACSVHGGFMPVSHDVCDKFVYDIFKKKVRRHKSCSSNDFNPDAFKL